MRTISALAAFLSSFGSVATEGIPFMFVSIPGMLHYCCTFRARIYAITKGAVKLTHVNDSIMEIFDITGFIDILTIE